MSSQTITFESETREGARAPEKKRRRVNVGLAERLVSTAAGAGLVAWGIRKHSLAALAGAAVGSDLIYRGVSGNSILYRALGIDTAGTKKAGSHVRPDAPRVRRSITIERSPEELYDFWRDTGNLARIVGNLAEVTAGSDGLTHWSMRGPLKQVMEWDSRYTVEDRGRRLAWETVPGATMANRGEIIFRPGPGDSGTEVILEMQYEPPLGGFGESVAKTFGKAAHGVAEKTLRRFKSLAETGEIPTLEHNVSGRGESDLF